MGAYISQVYPMAQQTPGAGPVLMKLLQWGLAKFRVSSEIESVIDQAVAAMQQAMAQPPQPQGPTPEQQIEQAKLQLEAEKIQSNERIAAMEAQSDQQIAALKATIDLQKIEMKAKFDQMAAQFDQFQQMMQMQTPEIQVEKVAGALEQTAMSNEAMREQMQMMMQQMARKRRRIPIRDQNGDILEVREVDDDEEDDLLPGAQLAMNGGVPDLPPAISGAGPELQS